MTYTIQPVNRFNGKYPILSIEAQTPKEALQQYLFTYSINYRTITKATRKIVSELWDKYGQQQINIYDFIVQNNDVIAPNASAMYILDYNID